MKILGIIPARGGSKGIPRKNLVDVCGQPLITYTIHTTKALLSKHALNRCIVSTDDDEIAAVSRNAGADVPFMRPAEAATDTASALAYVLHALDALEEQGEFYNAVMLLQPTSPLRNVEAIVGAVEEFCNSDSDALISCYQEDYINEMVMYNVQDNGLLKPRNPLHNKGVRRQEHGSSMVRNGVLYLTRVPYLRETGQLICEQPMLLEMSKIDSIDVDTMDDLNILRAIVSFRGKEFPS